MKHDTAYIFRFYDLREYSRYNTKIRYVLSSGCNKAKYLNYSLDSSIRAIFDTLRYPNTCAGLGSMRTRKPVDI